MGRRSDNRPRIYGPYQHGDQHRVHVVTRCGGKRTTIYQTFATRDLADAFIAGARDEAQGITVNHAVKAFLDAKRAKGRAEVSVEAYEGRLQAMLGHVMQRPVRYLNGRGAELYDRTHVYPSGHKWSGRRRTADTHRNILTTARMLGAFCVKQKWLRANPFAEVEPVGQRVHGADKIRLTIDESRKLEAWCIERATNQWAVLTLAYLYLGPRNSELTKRDVRDVDDGGRVLWIGKTKSTAGRRHLIVPEPLAGMLRAIAANREPDAPLFLSERGTRLRINRSYQIVKLVCGWAGVPVVPPQALRRTNATLANDAGMNGPAVAAHLGHGSVAIARESYIERGAAEAADARRAFHVIRGGKG